MAKRPRRRVKRGFLTKVEGKKDIRFVLHPKVPAGLRRELIKYQHEVLQGKTQKEFVQQVLQTTDAIVVLHEFKQDFVKQFDDLPVWFAPIVTGGAKAIAGRLDLLMQFIRKGKAAHGGVSVINPTTSLSVMKVLYGLS